MQSNANKVCETWSGHSHSTCWQEETLHFWNHWFLGTAENSWVGNSTPLVTCSVCVYIKLKILSASNSLSRRNLWRIWMWGVTESIHLLYASCYKTAAKWAGGTSIRTRKGSVQCIVFFAEEKQWQMCARMSLRCSLLYLNQYRQTSPELLAVGDGTKSPTIVGDVFIHRSAKVHPSAKVFFQAHLTVLFFLNICIDSRNMKIETQGLRVFEGNSSGSKSKTHFWMRNCAWFFWSFQLGPNVSISANARIGPGVRLIGCIILDGVEVKVSIFTLKVTSKMPWLTRCPYTYNMYYGYEGSLIVSDILSLMDWLDIALSDFLQWYLLQENAVVIHSIVGWKSLIGRWARVQVSTCHV